MIYLKLWMHLSMVKIVIQFTSNRFKLQLGLQNSNVLESNVQMLIDVVESVTC